MTRKGYLSDVSDDEWAFVAPYLTLMREAAPQREHSLREVFNGLRYIVRTGMQWRMMPHDVPPWHTVCQQTQRWLKAGVFEDRVRNLRMRMRASAAWCATTNAWPRRWLGCISWPLPCCWRIGSSLSWCKVHNRL